MKYSEYNDYELVYYASENSEEAHELIFKKYGPVIRKIAARFYSQASNNGLDMNDLIQEGMLGLTKAIEQFDETKDTTFYTFATRCIERKIMDLLYQSGAYKNKYLNESIPLDNTDDTSLYERLGTEVVNPEKIIFDFEDERNLVELLKEGLTDFECQVFLLKYNGFDYKEIASKLNKDPKSVDNAIQRIKIKFNKVLEKINN